MRVRDKHKKRVYTTVFPYKLGWVWLLFQANKELHWTTVQIKKENFTQIHHTTAIFKDLEYKLSPLMLPQPTLGSNKSNVDHIFFLLFKR